MSRVAGYVVLPVPLAEVGCAAHSLYLKEHHTGNSSSSSSSSSSGGGKTKTLFVGSVDLQHGMTHEDIAGYLRELFSPLGAIEAVSVSSFAEAEGKRAQATQGSSSSSGDGNVSSGASRFAHVQFAKASSVKAVLQAVTNGLFSASSSMTEITRRWGLGSALRVKSNRELRESFPLVDVDRADMKRRVDQAMAEFEEQEQLARLARERASRQPDADGFMPVQHRKKRKRQSESGGRKGGSGSTSAIGRNRGSSKKARVGDAEAAGGGGKVLKNFYGFQHKEEKQNALLKLRQQFDQDRAKVAKLREQRKFKPF